jgi:hypothetical protein
MLRDDVPESDRGEIFSGCVDDVVKSADFLKRPSISALTGSLGEIASITGDLGFRTWIAVPVCS